MHTVKVQSGKFWRRMGVGLLCASFVMTFPALLQAASLQLQAPDRTAKGDAFEVSAQSDVAVKNMTFHWRGKKYSVLAEPQGGGSVARILLPVPVDKEEGTSLQLEASADHGGKRLVARKNVALYSKKRPVQKLTVEGKFVNPPAHEMERIANDRRKVNAVITRFSPDRRWALPMLRPVPGEISSLYGLKRVFNGEPRSVHKGLDMRGAQGTPIKAAADGTVALAENLYFSGNAVYLDHGQGVFTAYLHMSETHVQPGQMVRRGEVIGLVGATGRVTGPHLHLTFMVQGVPVDPDPLMEKALPTPVKEKRR